MVSVPNVLPVQQLNINSTLVIRDMSSPATAACFSVRPVMNRMMTVFPVRIVLVVQAISLTRITNGAAHVPKKTAQSHLRIAVNPLAKAAEEHVQKAQK